MVTRERVNGLERRVIGLHRLGLVITNNGLADDERGVRINEKRIVGAEDGD